MKAAIFVENEKPLVIEEVTLDAPAAGQVHVKWGACGVCHSDVSIWNGTLPLPPPVVLGHEGAGVVAAVGEGVKEFSVGDHVIGSFVPTCGECFYCRNGQAFVCEQSLAIGLSCMPFTRPDGSKTLGVVGGLAGFAEETIVSEAAIVKIPNDFPLDQAALIGCGVTTGVGAALFAAKVSEGSTAVVIGCGGVGLAAVQGCKIAKAQNIVAVDLNPQRRKDAEELGATHSVDPSEVNVLEFLQGITEGRGADYVFEVVGHPDLQRQAYEWTRPGGVCCWVGIPKMDSETTVPGALVALQNKTIVGTMYGSANVKQDFAKLVEFAKKGDINLEKMVSRRIKLEEVNDAFRAMLEGEVIRSVIIYD
ncbi:MAG: Zn-dependent alcohol dehydrogenase [Myxococcales bacterium]|nr:MAG: Zn-dependent alcohol dehydrogenase [Myxococcales bacterium]